LADTIGYTPLFGALGAFDIIGATLLIILMRGVSRDARPREADAASNAAA
ncbi:MAG: MFS transporter, partial [Paraburkholderia graminis]